MQQANPGFLEVDVRRARGYRSSLSIDCSLLDCADLWSVNSRRKMTPHTGNLRPWRSSRDTIHDGREILTRHNLDARLS